MTRRRTLRPEEEALWRKVADTADPLHKNRKAAKAKPPATPVAPAKPAPVPDLPDARPMARSPRKNGLDLAPTIASQIEAAPIQMDRKTHTQMKRGRLSPEARIDLHGMTLDRAHPALTQFILRAQAQGKRLVLVITGKGKQDRSNDPIPVRTGILRHQVPQWLATPPLAQAVLQITQAHQKHGGGGAYYVYLRRNR